MVVKPLDFLYPLKGIYCGWFLQHTSAKVAFEVLQGTILSFSSIEVIVK